MDDTVHPKNNINRRENINAGKICPSIAQRTMLNPLNDTEKMPKRIWNNRINLDIIFSFKNFQNRVEECATLNSPTQQQKHL